MNFKFDKLEQSVDEIKQDKKELQERNEQLENRISEMNEKITKLDCIAVENKHKHEKLEAQSRQDNLKFYNIPENDKHEIWAETERLVRKYKEEELNLTLSSISIERAYIIHNTASPRPVIFKLSFTRSKLIPFMLDQIHINQDAYLNYDKLIISGKPLYLTKGATS